MSWRFPGDIWGGYTPSQVELTGAEKSLLEELHEPACAAAPAREAAPEEPVTAG
ncbi:hypothetical protein [Streptomyces sp. HNM0574]|uniref:hypothetical protein n=1 Tax=Streptomyces sp. HNM0574 TaxID=2714954 RepID=UPI001469D0F2|nr:hypothetical protein [Streptomyces sp. HNM0574]NLU69587.1 hypothetical protein [Streptomyces sp. HNM0574]